ncbi:MAG: aminotransferase class I/II-fold pyridoxal phosphate-dependent enzyme, partial [Usitatibacter sp.]
MTTISRHRPGSNWISCDRMHRRGREAHPPGGARRVLAGEEGPLRRRLPPRQGGELSQRRHPTALGHDDRERGAPRPRDREDEREAGGLSRRFSAQRRGPHAADLGALRTLIRPRTKVIVVNSPHNPTGYHMPETMQREIVALAESRGIALF